MLALACRLRPPEELGPDRIVRLASEAGFEGLALDTSATLSGAALVARDALRCGLQIAAMVCPLAESALARGKRLPHLHAIDPEERLSALKLAVQGLEAGGSLGVAAFVLETGPVALEAKESDLRAAFARREMGKGERGWEILRAALDERRARGPALLDAFRSALEPLLAQTERSGAQLTLPVAATPWQLPSPREAQQLLQEFSGAPLGICLSPARWAVLEALNLPRAAERWAELAPSARLLWASDCVGLEADLVWGVGEMDPEHVRQWPRSVTTVVTGNPDSTFKEVQRARRRLAEAFRADVAEASSPGTASSGPAR
jgi:hypothetical protein